MKILLKSGIFSIREVAKQTGYPYTTLYSKVNDLGRSKWTDQDEIRIREFLINVTKALHNENSLKKICRN